MWQQEARVSLVTDGANDNVIILLNNLLQS